MTLPRSDDPAYGYTVHLGGSSFEQAREAVTAALKLEGFGILTEIDVKQTLQKKLGAEFRKYVILGACNPELAFRGLQAELALGLLLPCNVCVWEEDGGAAVSVLRPDLMLGVAANLTLSPVAEEADRRLRRVVDSLRSK